MAKLKDKIENGLNDVRILILGAQVLIGADFRVFFEPDLPTIPHATQLAQLIGCGLMVLGLGPLMLPAAYHQVVDDGEDTPHISKLTSTALNYGLLPFAIGLGLGLYMTAQKLAGTHAAWISGTLIGGLALVFWYGAGYMNFHDSKSEDGQKDDGHKENGQQGTPLTDKIKQVLTEARMVLPGTQALLGFQVVIFLMQDFDKLPSVSKWIHFGSLVAVSLSAVLLITPAAYHRIAFKGEDSEEFRIIAARLMLAAMFFLGLGLSGDFFVITYKITHSLIGASGCSGGLLAFFYTLWFAFPGWKRWAQARG
jgi:hypothetical protein